MANKPTFTEPEELELLNNTIQLVVKGALSYRAGAQRLRQLTGKKFSHEGLRKAVNKWKKKNGEERLGDKSRELPDE